MERIPPQRVDFEDSLADMGVFLFLANPQLNYLMTTKVYTKAIWTLSKDWQDIWSKERQTDFHGWDIRTYVVFHIFFFSAISPLHSVHLEYHMQKCNWSCSRENGGCFWPRIVKTEHSWISNLCSNIAHFGLQHMCVTKCPQTAFQTRKLYHMQLKSGMSIELILFSNKFISSLFFEIICTVLYLMLT